MKKFNLISCLTVGLFVSSASYSATPSIPLFMEKGSGSIAPYIYNMNIITPGNKDLYLKTVNLYGGYSKLSPCSDLTLLLPPSDGMAIPGVTGITSSDFLDLARELHITRPWTCFKMTAIYKSKTYDYGNIQLTWNGSQYTAATPSYVTWDFTK